MFSAINKKFWRNGMALSVLVICFWQVRLASAQTTLVINFPVQGWYLVSLPLTVADSSARAIFSTAFDFFEWNNATGRYVRPTTLQTGRGYWVLIGAPTTVAIFGTRFSQFRRHYLPGWHIVGSLIDSVNFANPDDTPDRSVLLPLFAWDAGNQRYYPTNFLEQSYGHWMAVLQECDVTFKSGSTMIAAPGSDKLSRQAFYQRFGAMPPPPSPPQSATAATPSSLAKLAADHSALFFADAEFAESNPVLASLQIEGAPQRIFTMPPAGRIEFPDPLKSITSPRPERRLPGEFSPQPPITSSPEPISLDRVPPPIQPEPAPEIDKQQTMPDRTGKIALQINTVPTHCAVIVDDKMVGQSPLTVYVDRFSDHVVQISRDGYAERIRLLDHHFFGNESTHILLEKLELKK